MMKFAQFISWFVPQVSYVAAPRLEIEVSTMAGTQMLLRREKSLGEDILFKCYEKQTNLFRGFVVKNIKHGFYGNLCDDATAAIASADDKWFEVMGFHPTQRQR